MEFLLDGIRAVTPQQCVMYVVGALLIYLAIKRTMSPRFCCRWASARSS